VPAAHYVYSKLFKLQGTNPANHYSRRGQLTADYTAQRGGLRV